MDCIVIFDPLLEGKGEVAASLFTKQVKAHILVLHHLRSIASIISSTPLILWFIDVYRCLQYWQPPKFNYDYPTSLVYPSEIKPIYTCKQETCHLQVGSYPRLSNPWQWADPIPYDTWCHQSWTPKIPALTPKPKGRQPSPRSFPGVYQESELQNVMLHPTKLLDGNLVLEPCVSLGCGTFQRKTFHCRSVHGNCEGIPFFSQVDTKSSMIELWGQKSEVPKTDA